MKNKRLSAMEEDAQDYAKDCKEKLSKAIDVLTQLRTRSDFNHVDEVNDLIDECLKK